MPDEVVGMFSYGRVVGQFAETLETWRVTTDSGEVARAVARLLGGIPNPVIPEGGGILEVLTKKRRVRVTFGGAHCIALDGAGSRGMSCLAAERERAKSGVGPGPDVVITFGLAARAGLGLFSFRTRSWKFLESALLVRNSLIASGASGDYELVIRSAELAGEDRSHQTYWTPDLNVAS